MLTDELACRSHLADPGIVPQGRDPAGWAAWTNNMTQLAARPNVFLMVDGAPEAASHSAAKYGNWTEAEIRRYVEFGIRTFGFDRCMFAGNWFWLNRKRCCAALRCWASC